MFSLNNNNKYLSYDNNIIRYTQYECYIWNLYEFNKTVDTIFYIVNKDKEILKMLIDNGASGTEEMFDKVLKIINNQAIPRHNLFS